MLMVCSCFFSKLEDDTILPGISSQRYVSSNFLCIFFFLFPNVPNLEIYIRAESASICKQQFLEWNAISYCIILYIIIWSRQPELKTLIIEMRQDKALLRVLLQNWNQNLNLNLNCQYWFSANTFREMVLILVWGILVRDACEGSLTHPAHTHP